MPELCSFVRVCVEGGDFQRELGKFVPLAWLSDISEQGGRREREEKREDEAPLRLLSLKHTFSATELDGRRFFFCGEVERVEPLLIRKRQTKNSSVERGKAFFQECRGQCPDEEQLVSLFTCGEADRS